MDIESRPRGAIQGILKKLAVSLEQTLPSLLARRVVSVVVEGNDVRVLSMVRGSMDKWASVPVNPRFFKQGVVIDPVGVGQAIRAAMETGKVRGKVVSAISGLGVISRIIDLPMGARSNMASVVDREARRLMGFSREGYHLVWSPIAEKRPQLRVFVAAVSQESIYALEEAFKAAGVKVSGFSLKPLALAWAVNERDAIIANGERNSIELVIVVEDIPVLIRSVFLGEGALPPEYATARIVEELIRTVAFYNETHRDSPLDPGVPVYLTGEVADNPALAQSVASATGRSVPPLTSPISCPPELPLPMYTTNIGLLLKFL